MGKARIVDTQRSGTPLMVSRFAVTFKTLSPTQKLGFRAIRGLSFTNELLDYPEGTDLQTIRHLPGPMRVGDVTFEGGVTSSDESFVGLGISSNFALALFESWGTNSVVRGRHDRVTPLSPVYEDIDIDVHDRSGEPRLRVTLLRCAIKAFELGDLDAMANEVWLNRLVVSPEGYAIKGLGGESVFPREIPITPSSPSLANLLKPLA